MFIAYFICVSFGGRGLAGSCFRSYSMFIVSRVGFNSSSGVQATKQTQRPRSHCQQVVSYAPAGTDEQADGHGDSQAGRQRGRQLVEQTLPLPYVPQRSAASKLCINLISFGAPKSMQYECEVKAQTVRTHPTCVYECVCVCSSVRYNGVSHSHFE